MLGFIRYFFFLETSLVAHVASQRVRSEDILLIKIGDYTLLISHEAFLQSWAKKMRLRGVVHSSTEINCAFTGLNIFSIALGVAPQIVVDDILDCRMPDSGFLPTIGYIII